MDLGHRKAGKDASVSRVAAGPFLGIMCRSEAMFKVEQSHANFLLASVWLYAFHRRYQMMDVFLLLIFAHHRSMYSMSLLAAMMALGPDSTDSMLKIDQAEEGSASIRKAAIALIE